MNKIRLIDTFLDLVRIDSPSGYEAAVAAYCKHALEAAGCSVTFDESAAQTGSDVGNLIATLPGTVPGRLYFSAHMDCVEPCCGVKPVIRDGVVYSDGSTVLGGDDKVGIAAIIEMVRCLTDAQGESSAAGDCVDQGIANETHHNEARPNEIHPNETHPNEAHPSEAHSGYPEIKIILSVQEERGLLGAKAFDVSEFDGEFCYVLDAAGSPGLVVNGAPYQQSYKATFTGVAAHAGIEPEAGASAIVAAARAIVALPQGRLNERTTANVGTIAGGQARNIVAENCEIVGEFRSHDLDSLLEVREQINAALLAACEERVQVKIDWQTDYQGFYVSEDAPVVKLALESALALGLDASCEISGGGADTNIYAAGGLAAVSLASGMKKIHSTNEQLPIKDLEALTALILQIAYNFSA
ncbi:hypothetical protein FACS1894185_1010 [Betaproteobacteria bacterium]|nr:hypothetical protein FACS1894185_1010 [Betaproteobacteria bacterium]